MEIINNNDSLLVNNFEVRGKLLKSANYNFHWICHWYILFVLQILTQLPTILKEEEDEAYNNEVGHHETDDIINNQHNAAVRTIAIGHIVEKVLTFV